MSVRSRRPGGRAGSAAAHRDVSRNQIRERQPRFLLMWNEIPNWYQDNEYILSGYRAVSGSYRKCFGSIISIHNETVNIFSHLIGSVLFFALPIPVYYSLQPRYGTATTADVVVFSTFFFGVAICFALSATYHAPRLCFSGIQKLT
ncbi:hypothetical protein CUC08_Gglean006835 [Alternaria sp. MG1]|nr:hypothetical protein CUC08_Gglean006835 [Alternaria sp. MG1]